jgi:gliding motility-associated-like protein
MNFKARILAIFLPIIGLSSAANAQMSATFTQTINTKCQGADCNYTGPSILINEMMMSPTNFNGCLSGTFSGGDCKGEWIELYNPNLCEPIDISCYYLGSNVFTAGIPPLIPNTNAQGVFIIPNGTIIPPGGFCLIRGENAPSVPAGPNIVEVVVPGNITDMGVCVNGGDTRLWFPDNGGWFGFYDRNGTPQDAVSWGTVSGTNTTITCIPTSTGCSNSVTQLASYDAFPSSQKTKVFSSSPPTGQSARRMPDGGGWSIDQGATPTYATCNSTCATVSASTCDGTATINVTGGTAPYTYKWSDSQAQLTQTATGLCAGTYQVTVKDANNVTQVFSVTIVNYVPTVTFPAQAAVCNKGQTIPLNATPTPTTGQTGVYAGTGVSGTNFSVTTAGDGTFPLTYTFTDANGCKNTANSSITVNPQPTAAISGVNANYCLSNQTITPTLSPAGGVLSGPGVSNNQFSIIAAGVGTHTLKYVVTTPAGCSDSTTVNVTISGGTPPTFTIQPQICLHAPAIQMNGSPAGGTYVVDGTTITGDMFNPATYGVGNHSITYNTTDPNNPQCLAQATASIEVIDGGAVTSNIPDFFCYGAADFNVVMTPAGGQLTGTLVSADKLSISTANSGTYSVDYQYTSPEGCQSSYTKNFTVGQNIKIEASFSQDCFQNVTLNAVPKVGSFVSYQWTEGSSVLGSGATYIGKVEQVGVHTFTVEATDNKGCKTQAAITDTVNQGVVASMFQIPNVITANGDNVNDYIDFPLMNNDCIEYKVFILNRWGNQVFEATKSNPRFEGKDKSGSKLTDGVYFYKVVSKDFDCESSDYKPVCYGFITVISK